MELYGLKYVHKARLAHSLELFWFFPSSNIVVVEIAQEIDVYSMWIDHTEEVNAGGHESD
jgi:hypothetical protein